MRIGNPLDTLRACLRRCTRLTNAFSKKIENHVSALALYFVWRNFCRRRGTLRTTPAQAAGFADGWRDAEWIVGLVDAAAPKPGPRGPCRPRKRRADSD